VPSPCCPVIDYARRRPYCRCRPPLDSSTPRRAFAQLKAKVPKLLAGQRRARSTSEVADANPQRPIISRPKVARIQDMPGRHQTARTFIRPRAPPEKTSLRNRRAGVDLLNLRCMAWHEDAASASCVLPWAGPVPVDTTKARVRSDYGWLS